MSWRTVLTVSSSATGICIVQAFAHSDQRFWPYSHLRVCTTHWHFLPETNWAMIKVICNSKSMHTQRTGPHESSTTYQATFIVRSEGQSEIDSKFDIVLTETEYDRYDVGKTYTFGP